MNDFDSCDQNTGECLKCLNNTAGPNCAECKYWHYGDPITLKNCQECECDQCGSQACNNQTGECSCKPNVKGYNCASCGDNQWGFNQCQGCNKCDCDPTGSLSAQCDAQTGQCQCKPGVDGRKCDKCLPDHWNFTPEGCTNCNCAKAGVIVTNTGGFSCNATTGYCSCIPGVKGKQCDECDSRWVLVKHQGCHKCDTCVDTLLDDIELLFGVARGIENGNKDSSLTFKAHNKLTGLEKQFMDLKSLKEKKLESSPLPLLSLQNSINGIKEGVLPELRDAIDYPIVEKIEDLKLLLKETQVFDKNVDALRNEFEALKTLMDQLDRNDLMVENAQIIEADMDIYRRIVEQISQKNFNRTESNLAFF